MNLDKQLEKIFETLNLNNNLYNETLEFASIAHRGQHRANGESYIEHPIRVSQRVEELIEKIIALLHDTLEDTAVTYDQLLAKYGDIVADSVLLLTRKKDETYKQFIERVKNSGNQHAINVKIADLEDNIKDAETFRPSLVKRYEKALQLLRNEPIKEAKMEKFQDIVQANELLAKGLRLCGEIERIGGEGSQCLVVGGAVRDLLFHKEIDDVDLATNVSMEEIEKNFKVDEIGANKTFGIVNVHFEGDEFEVAHYRTETDYSDSRHPDKVNLVNNFSDDSARRDFTFNAMGLDKNVEIIDFHGGLEDLNNRLLKAVGNPKQRFQEDALRILRAARQAATLGCKIEDSTKEAIVELKDTIKTVSSERVAKEMFKAASSGPSLAHYIEHLDETGLLQIIFPEMYALKPFQHSLKHHPEYGGNVYGHVLGCLYASRSKDPITNIAILGHDFGKAVTYRLRDGKHTYYGHEGAGVPIVEAMGQRLKMSAQDIEIMKFCAAKHMLIHKLFELTRPKLIELVNHPFWKYLKDVAYADEKSRLHLFNEDDFNRKIQHAENVAEEVNLGGGPEGLKKRLKNLVNGDKVLEWIPDLNKPENRPLIGKLIKNAHEWILTKNEFNLTDKTVHDFVIKNYEELKNPKNFKQFSNL